MYVRWDERLLGTQADKFSNSRANTSGKQKNNPDIIFDIWNCEKGITSKFLTPENKRQDKREFFDEMLKL